MKDIFLSWVVGTAVYAVTLLGGAAVIGGLARNTGELPPTWLLLVVPPVLAGATAVLIRRAKGRPQRTFGLAPIMMPALVAVTLGLYANAQATARAEVPASALVSNVLVPLALFVLTGLGVGFWRRARWSGRSSVPAHGTVG